LQQFSHGENCDIKIILLPLIEMNDTRNFFHMLHRKENKMCWFQWYEHAERYVV